MCIAILNIKSKLSKATLDNSFENNNQGAGLLYVKDRILTTFKTYDKKDLIKKYYEVRKEISTPIVLHFRIATSGYSKDNLHPFLVNESLGFVHNGVIYGLGNKDFSDTYQFNEMCKKLPLGFIYNDGIKELISSFIGSDKMVFLESSNRWTIINEANGHWFEGNWYSNSSYKQVNNYVWEGNKMVNKGTWNPKTVESYFKNDYEDKPAKKAKTYPPYKDVADYLHNIYLTNTYAELSAMVKYDGYLNIWDAYDDYKKTEAYNSISPINEPFND